MRGSPAHRTPPKKTLSRMARTKKHTLMRELRQLPTTLYPKTTQEAEEKTVFDGVWGKLGFKSEIATRRRTAAFRKTRARTKKRCLRAEKRSSKAAASKALAD